jgi:hypothetical protein
LKKLAPPFDAEEFLSTPGDGRTLATYKKNARIFTQGSAADAVFYLRAGGVKLTVTSEQGREAVVAILAAGQFFGEGSLAGQSKRISTATAVVSAEFFHEQVPQAGLHHLQRQDRGSLIAAQRRAGRPAAGEKSQAQAQQVGGGDSVPYANAWGEKPRPCQNFERHGLNLGLKDAAALCDCIGEAARLGGPHVLKRYERWRRFDSFVMAAATDGLNELFSNDIAPVSSCARPAVTAPGVGLKRRIRGYP